MASNILSLRLKKGMDVASTILPRRLKNEGGRGVTCILLYDVILLRTLKIEGGRGMASDRFLSRIEL